MFFLFFTCPHPSATFSTNRSSPLYILREWHVIATARCVPLQLPHPTLRTLGTISCECLPVIPIG